MAHSNTDTMQTLFDIEPISLSNDGELDDFDFDLDHESANMIFNDTDSSDDDLADIFTDPHIDDYSLITYDSIEAPKQKPTKKPEPVTAPAPQLITPQSKNKAIDLHGYNPVRDTKTEKKQGTTKKSPSYGTSYNFEAYQASCDDLKKRDAPPAERPLKKRRVVTRDESHNYNFEMYQNMDFQEADTTSIVLSSYQTVNEGLQKLAESRRRTELSRRQLAMQRTTTTVAPQPQPQFTRAHQIQACLSLNAAAQKLHQHMSINDSSSALYLSSTVNRAAFFSGSRGTLTNGLEHTRSQLQMYNNNCL